MKLKSGTLYLQQAAGDAHTVSHSALHYSFTALRGGSGSRSLFAFTRPLINLRARRDSDLADAAESKVKSRVESEMRSSPLVPRSAKFNGLPIIANDTSCGSRAWMPFGKLVIRLCDTCRTRNLRRDFKNSGDMASIWKRSTHTAGAK